MLCGKKMQRMKAGVRMIMQKRGYHVYGGGWVGYGQGVVFCTGKDSSGLMQEV
jgi:hypothetical protein